LKNILVTGGAGFIGSNFIHLLHRTFPRALIVNLDLLTYAGSIENLKSLEGSKRYRFVQGDICDQELVDSIFQNETIDTVVHFAAETHVDRSLFGPARFIQTNVFGTFTLLEVARSYWTSTSTEGQRNLFHHVSTDEVYGSLGAEDPPSNEDSPYVPSSPYAASKASSDHLVRAYSHSYALPVTISNCTNNYGPYQFPEKLIPLMISNALQGEFLPIYGDGLNIRDWLYVEDHCEAIIKILQKGELGETYNIGGANQTTNIDLVRQLCKSLDELRPLPEEGTYERQITFVPDRPGHDQRYDLDIRKIKRDLKWSPKHDLASGLSRTIGWYLENEDWLDMIQKRPDYNEWVQQNYSRREDQV
jgi:dTDP-glucose 4,6-dehydratase